MRVKVLSSRVGAYDAFTGGQEYDMADDRARKWVARGFAVAVESAIVEPTAEVTTDVPSIEMAVQPGAIEVAAKRRGRPRK